MIRGCVCHCMSELADYMKFKGTIFAACHLVYCKISADLTQLGPSIMGTRHSNISM